MPTTGFALALALTAVFAARTAQAGTPEEPPARRVRSVDSTLSVACSRHRDWIARKADLGSAARSERPWLPYRVGCSRPARSRADSIRKSSLPSLPTAWKALGPAKR